VEPALPFTVTLIFGPALEVPSVKSIVETKDGISSAVNALKLGAAFSPSEGPTKTKFAPIVLTPVPPLAISSTPLSIFEAFKEVNSEPSP